MFEKEVLFDLGKVIVVHIESDDCELMIIGHRVINPQTMRAWDYVGVPYPEGLKRVYNKSNLKFVEPNFHYFNHTNIRKKEIPEPWEE